VEGASVNWPTAWSWARDFERLAASEEHDLHSVEFGAEFGGRAKVVIEMENEFWVADWKFAVALAERIDFGDPCGPYANDQALASCICTIRGSQIGTRELLS